jgi:hypothetical protein
MQCSVETGVLGKQASTSCTLLLTLRVAASSSRLARFRSCMLLQPLRSLNEVSKWHPMHSAVSKTMVPADQPVRC